MKSFFTLAGLLIMLNAFPQDTKNTVGLRFGYTWGITYQAFVDEDKAFEGLLGFRDRGVQFYGLFQRYKPAFSEYTDHFYWYYGLGGHAGFVRWEDYDEYEPYHRYYVTHFGPVIGFDGNIGLEFWFYKIPLAIGLDYKPFIELFGPRLFNFMDCAFTIKYTF
jgi:hypothetical protein